MGAANEGKERVLGTVRHEDDVTATTAVAAVRPSFGNEFLTAEGYAARSPVARLDMSARFVLKHGSSRRKMEARRLCALPLGVFSEDHAGESRGVVVSTALPATLRRRLIRLAERS
jgi:hypothetical protein